MPCKHCVGNRGACGVVYCSVLRMSSSLFEGRIAVQSIAFVCFVCFCFVYSIKRAVNGFPFVLVVLGLPLVGLTVLVFFWSLFKFVVRVIWMRHCGRFAKAESLGKEWEPSIRERFDVWFHSSTLGMIWNVWQGIISVVAFILYVISLSYVPYSTAYETIYLMEIILTVFVMIDYGCNFFIARNKLFWIWSPTGLIDLVSIVPVLSEITLRAVYGSALRAGVTFLRVLRVLRVVRITRVFRVSKLASTEVQKELVQWVLMVVCIVLVCAGLMQAIMSPEYPDFSFNTALYFTVVTLATVGYGDYVPKTAASRGVVTAMIFLAYPLAAYQTARLIYLQSLYDPKKGGMRRPPQRIHLVLTGNLSFLNILSLFREIFHPSRTVRNISVCLLSTTPPDFELNWMLQHPFYQERVTFLLGNALSPADLIRARADVARMVIVLGPRSAEDPRTADAETVLRYLSIRRTLPKVRVAVQLLGWEELRTVSPFDPAVSLTDYKMGLLALSVRAPGFSTLLSNLVRIDGEPEDNTSTWHLKYLHGAGHELYTCRLSAAFDGVTFAEMRRLLYDMFGVVVIGCRRKSMEFTEMLERDVIMAEGDAVFVIAQDDLIVRTLEFLQSLPHGEVHRQPTAISSIRQLVSEGHIPQRIHRSSRSSATPPMRVSSPGLLTSRVSSEESPGAVLDGLTLEEALHRNSPGQWRQCFLLEESARPLAAVVVSTLPEHVRDHVCVVGPSNGIFRLLLRFRSLKSRSSCERAVVCMFDEDPSPSTLHLISWLPQVYFVKGALLSQHDLTRIGLFGRARSLCVLSSSRITPENVSPTDAVVADADVICTFRRIYEMASHYGHLQSLVCELAYGTNLRYLSFETHDDSASPTDSADATKVKWAFLELLSSWISRRKAQKLVTTEELDQRGHVNLPFHNSVFYCSGLAMPSAILTAAVANVIWNPDIFDITAVLTGGVGLSVHQALAAGEVFQWEVPTGFVNRTYGVLFKSALGLNCVCLGLYRSKTWETAEPKVDAQGQLSFAKGDVVPPLREKAGRFVYTNPPREEVLHEDDLVYVIARTEAVRSDWDDLDDVMAFGGSLGLTTSSLDLNASSTTKQGRGKTLLHRFGVRRPTQSEARVSFNDVPLMRESGAVAEEGSSGDEGHDPKDGEGKNASVAPDANNNNNHHDHSTEDFSLPLASVPQPETRNPLDAVLDDDHLENGDILLRSTLVALPDSQPAAKPNTTDGSSSPWDDDILTL